MTGRIQHNRVLFRKHLGDLKRVCSTAADVFVCPICFGVFTEPDIANERLTLGHVWPNNFYRQQSEEAKHQHVLLCKECNSKAGGNGDAAMQQIERYMRSREADEPYEAQVVEILAPPGQPLDAIKLRATVRRQGAGVTIGVQRGRKGQPLYNQQNWTRAKEYLRHGGSLLVNPYGGDWQRGIAGKMPGVWKFAQAGLVTSAYLYAFYAFGYRYIFQSCLDLVRSYIKASFREQVDERLDFSNDKNMTVGEYSHFHPDPEIGYFTPYREEVSPHIVVYFLRYFIRLPLRFSFIVEFPENQRSNVTNEFSGAVMSGRSHVPHLDDSTCMWEVLFGEPDYYVEADEVRNKT